MTYFALSRLNGQETVARQLNQPAANWIAQGTMRARSTGSPPTSSCVADRLASPKNLTDVTDVVALPVKADGEGASSFGCASSFDACLVLELANCLRQTLARPRFVASSGATRSKSKGSVVICEEDRPELHETPPLRAPGGDTMLQANAFREMR